MKTMNRRQKKVIIATWVLFVISSLYPPLAYPGLKDTTRDIEYLRWKFIFEAQAESEIRWDLLTYEWVILAAAASSLLWILKSPPQPDNESASRDQSPD